MTDEVQISPAVARRRVRLALRRAREATGKSQSDVGSELGWSMSKVQRIESGEVSISGTDLRALAATYQTLSPAEIGDLIEQTRVARRQRWWSKPEYREHLTPALNELLEYETAATRIDVYQPVLVPGVLQTEATAKSILDFWNQSLSEDDRRIRREVRRIRREQVIERSGGPEYRLVLDESVLLRLVGGLQTAAEQLEALADAAELPNVNVRVITLARGALLGLLGPFVLVDLSEPGDEDELPVLYRESWSKDEFIKAGNQVMDHVGYFDSLWKLSLSTEASLRKIRAQAALLRSRVDDEPFDSGFS